MAEEPVAPRYRNYQPAAWPVGPAIEPADARRTCDSAATQGPHAEPIRSDPFAEDPPPGGPAQGESSYDWAYAPLAHRWKSAGECHGRRLQPGPVTNTSLQGEPLLRKRQRLLQSCGTCCRRRLRLQLSERPGRSLRDWYPAAPARENFSLFTGKQGFKGPVDLGVNGDFGYHGGGNWGMPLLDAYGIGYQAGATYLVSDFAGRTSDWVTAARNSSCTIGVFHRAVCNEAFKAVRCSTICATTSTSRWI